MQFASLFLLLSAAAPAAQAQQGGTGGIVVNVVDAANQRPIELVRVFLVGTTVGGTTTADGKVTLRNVPAGDATIIQAALGNPDLKPERSAEHETGFETQMLNERLSLDVTYYSKITQDASISAILPPSYGSVTSQLRNIGAVKNAGLEVSVTSLLVDREAFGWDISIATSANKNKVVSLGDTPPQIGTTSRIVPGYPISGQWARPITGWEDKNGDGLHTYFADPAKNEVFVGDSAIYRGSPTPRYMTTLTSGWDFFHRKLRITTM